MITRQTGKTSRRPRAKPLNEYEAFADGIVQSGQFKAAGRLSPSSSAITVRVRDGKTLTTDGPFAETKEQLGGYFCGASTAAPRRLTVPPSGFPPARRSDGSSSSGWRKLQQAKHLAGGPPV